MYLLTHAMSETLIAWWYYYVDADTSKNIISASLSSHYAFKSQSIQAIFGEGAVNRNSLNSIELALGNISSLMAFVVNKKRMIIPTSPSTSLAKTNKLNQTIL